jgi:hypothetical protein
MVCAFQGRDGRLGHNDDVCYLYPKKVESLAHVTQAACGSFREDIFVNALYCLIQQ